jgi:hydrogenase maturation protein HypF
MPVFHIHLKGLVQGVGFRPLAARLAREHGLSGCVSNGPDGLHVLLDAQPLAARLFFKALQELAPVHARITEALMTQELAPASFPDFRILESRTSGPCQVLPAPDQGICTACRHEMLDPANRRFRYPFTTCLACGPRYSITASMPYDRERTTMARFAMCSRCREEFEDPASRRYHAQTNSCPDCAIPLSYWQRQATGHYFEKKSSDVPSCLSAVLSDISQGRIVAVKGTGGYLLLCDATDTAAIQTLRQRKQRPAKPFALLYRDEEQLSGDVFASAPALSAFGSQERPVVLFKLRPSPKSGIAAEGIAPGLPEIGAMRADSPLMELLLQDWGKPLVATSGNAGGSPLYYEDEPALAHLGDQADSLLMHEREILLPLDDSVLRFSPLEGRRIMLRRSRGWAPDIPHPEFKDARDALVAMGADLKSTFAIRHAGSTYLSQYLGDLESYDAGRNFEKSLQHSLRLLDIQSARVLVDAHPGYHSAALGGVLAGEWSESAADLPPRPVQHHEAHFAAVLAENGLLHSSEPVLGVIWDGTGWGADRQIWGGEFFRFGKGRVERVGHLDYFPHLLGDKMSLEPRLSALSLCRGLPEARYQQLRAYFETKSWEYYRAYLQRGQFERMTSSVGRLFDGVAALLGLQGISSYEGEAALHLEQLAAQVPPEKWPPPYALPLTTQSLMAALLDDLHKGTEPAVVACRFHQTLVWWIDAVAAAQDIKKLAFSGGVFQNALLVDMLIRQLAGEYKLYFHRELPPNDECVSFGQLAWFFMNGSSG